MIPQQLSYLEAIKTLKRTRSIDLENKNLRIFSSCQLSQLDIYLKALYINNGYSVNIELPEYGTFHQTLITSKSEDENTDNLIIIMPWDFIESLNWRTGIPVNTSNRGFYKKEINNFFNLCDNLGLKNKKFIYLDCEFPNIFSNDLEHKIIRNQLRESAYKLSSLVIDDSLFCLSNFLSNGFPFKNKEVSKVAFFISKHLNEFDFKKKIIFLDLDNTLWQGILGEDGPKGLNASSDINGYLFFIFQTFLKNLKSNGILLAIISKNDPDLISEAFNENNFILNIEDFVEIIGSYEPKSFHIKKLLKKINLTEDAAIFIDDNEIEIQEVSLSSNQITCEKFVSSLNELPSFLEKIKSYFNFSNRSSEDKNRTQLYKLQLNEEVLNKNDKKSLDNYLHSLNQIFVFKEVSEKNINRAIQLINKTNQFNLNGIRLTKEEIIQITNKDNKFFIGELVDKNGSHGEILVLIINKKGTIITLVMSCRVFQRNVEFAFLAALQMLGYKELKFSYLKTKRNHPFLKFAQTVGVENTENNFIINNDQLTKITKQINKTIEVKIT